MATPTKSWLKRYHIAGIYAITSPSGRVYIGQSWSIMGRWRLHKHPSVRGCTILVSSFKKYGADAHKFEILHQLPLDVSADVLNQYEIFYIDHYKECGIKLMNIKGGGGNAKATEETKQKMRLAMKGVPRPDLRGRKAWNAGTKGVCIAWNKGRKGIYKASEETKKKMSAARIGKPHIIVKKRDPSVYKIIAEKNRGRKRSEETKRKIRENRTIPENVGKWNIGKVRSEENKKKISDSLKARTDNKGEGHNMAKLTNEQVLEIRNKYKPREYSLNRLARNFNISKRVVLDIIHRRIWKHI